jgi:hypothetical protein
VRHIAAAVDVVPMIVVVRVRTLAVRVEDAPARFVHADFCVCVGLPPLVGSRTTGQQCARYGSGQREDESLRAKETAAHE